MASPAIAMEPMESHQAILEDGINTKQVSALAYEYWKGEDARLGHLT
jgi:hypothetical protein